MKQPDFIMMAHNMRVDGVSQSGSDVVVHLRPGITITHSTITENLMYIKFEEDGKVFHIDSTDTLKTIYEMHLSHVDVIDMIREWCQDRLVEMSQIT